MIYEFLSPVERGSKLGATRRADSSSHLTADTRKREIKYISTTSFLIPLTLLNIFASCPTAFIICLLLFELFKSEIKIYGCSTKKERRGTECVRDIYDVTLCLPNSPSPSYAPTMSSLPKHYINCLLFGYFLNAACFYYLIYICSLFWGASEAKTSQFQFPF